MFTNSEIDEVLSARCWNFYADKVPYFKDSAQLMLKMQSGAGVIADVSYAAPNSLGFVMPTYWEFKIWGQDGMIKFNYNDAGVYLYKNGNSDVEIYDGINPDKNYFDKFLNDIYNNTYEYSDSVLTTVKETLKIQNIAK